MNAKVWIQWTDNTVVLETWDRSYELETVLTIAEARELSNALMNAAASAGANAALTRHDVV